MRPLEFSGVISRSQDMTMYKQNEEVKPMVEQQTILHNIQKDSDIKQEQVRQTKDEDMDRKYDAKEGNGGNEYYSSDKNKKKQQEEDGQVKIKGQASFDIKI